MQKQVHNLQKCREEVMLKIQLFAGNLLQCKDEEALITLDPFLAVTFQRISFDHGKYQVFM